MLCSFWPAWPATLLHRFALSLLALCPLHLLKHVSCPTGPTGLRLRYTPSPFGGSQTPFCALLCNPARIPTQLTKCHSSYKRRTCAQIYPFPSDILPCPTPETNFNAPPPIVIGPFLPLPSFSLLASIIFTFVKFLERFNLQIFSLAHP